MTTVLIDNYDSFTWNVYQYLCKCGAKVEVFRNDQTTIEHIKSLNPINIIISPGPGHPAKSAGISNDVIREFAGKIPIFGVCLGEQCMIEVFGGEVTYAGELMHGKTSLIKHDGKGVFFGVPSDISVTRYHSLAGNPSKVPPELEVTSWTDSGLIMGVRHRELCIEGVQFHPESVLSEHGLTIISNFLKLRGGRWSENPGFGVTHNPQSNGSLKDSIPSILTRIQEQRLRDVALAKSTPGQSPDDLRKLLSHNVAPPLIDFAARLQQANGNMAVLAEIKRASPTKGNIDLGVNAAEQALLYAQAGASAISVLTEPRWFKGSLNDMRLARQVIAHLPNRPAVLRKDFIIDTYQILEARLYGADSVLLIVAMLTDEQLSELYQFAKSLGMEPLVEVNNEEEMIRAVKLGARVIGVNNRNLHDFNVDMNTTSRLAELVPEGVILAALSGITGRPEIIKYIEQGVRAVLVGEAIMRAQDKVKFMNELLGLEVETKSQKNESTPPRRVLVKICGINTIEHAIEAARAGADFIGLIFAPKSRRRVTLESAAEIVKVVRSLSHGTKDETTVNACESQDWFDIHASHLTHRPKPLFVGVFQDQPLGEIVQVVSTLGLDLVQLHGNESSDVARYLPCPCIKAFHVDADSFSANLVPSITQPGYHHVSLLDTKAPAGNKHDGGTGVAFDWDIAKRVVESRENEFPIILAGGLTADNVVDAIQKVHPWCVDVSSGVETDGRKDSAKIRTFIQQAKSIQF
ncbi:uncharacterized protein VTP21DRAFT_3505 [Calcarisporiella thermophila]|uniref:uncharacterized protein n=1 Tax=Calcarisporiella thermophila TaxID=911321 RepID=UPI003741E917